MNKSTGKNISKNLSSKYSQEPLDHAKQSATDGLKIDFKRAFQKTVETTGDWFLKKMLIKLQKNPHKIPQRQLKVKQKYQKKDVYLEKKDSKLLTN